MSRSVLVVTIGLVMFGCIFFVPDFLGKRVDALEIENLEQAAQAGISTASIALGKIYIANPNVRNYELARKCFEKAIENGVDEGYAHLGDLYAGGLGVKKDLAKARELYSVGVQRNDPVCMNYLAILYLKENDEEKAGQLMLRSADLGYRSAQLNMGCALIFGNLKLEIDNERGARFINSASAQNFAPAFFFSGFVAQHGIGCKQDFQIAIEFYKKAYEMGAGCAGIELINIAEENPSLAKKNNIDLDSVKAQTYKYCLRSAKSGNIDDLVRIQHFLRNGIGGPINVALAEEIRSNARITLKRGVEEGSVFSKFYLGLSSLEDGDDNGLALIEDAAKSNFQPAKNYLAKRKP